jgi:hypothetical protein
METLKSLAENIKKEAENVEALRVEKSVAEEKIRDTLDKNCTEIILPVLKEYSDLLGVIAHALGGSAYLPSQSGYRNRELKCGLTMYLSDCHIGYKCSYSSSELIIGVGQSSRSTGCRSLVMAPYWVTAESTQQTLNELTEWFCEYLGTCVECLKSTSASLASEVEKLKNMLAASDTVQKNEDGTVEITLGGVRYVGTVVKERY